MSSTANILQETFANEVSRPNISEAVSLNCKDLVGHATRSTFQRSIRKKKPRDEFDHDQENLGIFPWIFGLYWLSGGTAESGREKPIPLFPLSAPHDHHHIPPDEVQATSVFTPAANSTKTCGKITYIPSIRLGEGSYNTVVYEGLLGQRQIAVKRLVLSCRSDHDRMMKELRILTQCDYHENIVRLYHYETETIQPEMDLVYIALEFCNQTLDQWVQSENGSMVRNNISLCQQMASGLHHLHDQGIVHRDIKPSNILLLLKDAEIKLKIADFGISREIPQDRTHITLHTVSGTAAWMAPEILEGNLKLTTKSDIFSLGCVFYYLLTNGKLLQNSRKVKLNWQALDPSLLAFVSLILMMTKPDPNERPSAAAVHSYHTFWPEVKVRNFLVAVSNALDRISPGSKQEISSRRLSMCTFRRPMRSATLAEFGIVNSMNSCWTNELCPVIRVHIEKNKYRSYDTKSACHLLRCMRNLDQHFTTQPKHVQEALGTHKDYTDYWLSRFPLLLDIVFLAFQDAATKSDDVLSSFYLKAKEYRPWPDMYVMLSE